LLVEYDAANNTKIPDLYLGREFSFGVFMEFALIRG